MYLLALGAVALAFFVILGRARTAVKRREWRFMSGAFAIAAFVGAAYSGLVHKSVVPAVVLTIAGVLLAGSTRVAGKPRPARPETRMGDDEARRILGVGPDATRQEIQAAYRRLMRLAHPDKGGTAGLAAQLNAARDRLLKK